jgi:Phosphotransferase system cellobiose-specific component IIC
MFGNKRFRASFADDNASFGKYPLALCGRKRVSKRHKQNLARFDFCFVAGDSELRFDSRQCRAADFRTFVICVSLSSGLFSRFMFVSFYSFTHRERLPLPFLGLLLYGMVERKYALALVNMVFIILSVVLYGLDVHGSPKGYFLDSIGIYSAIFTPIVFVYIFYVLYRRGLTKEIDAVWFLASSALVVSLILSFRQKIDVQHFAPYLVLALPLAAQTFYNSYRVRLPQFRRKYKAIFAVALLFLLANSGVVLFNKYLYRVLERPSEHFAYKMHIAKELADALHERGIDCVQTKKSMGLRLEFYGISKCNEFVLEEVDARENNGRDVTISYINKPIKFYSVTKVNNFTIR